jgi:hypothetical protein
MPISETCGRETIIVHCDDAAMKSRRRFMRLSGEMFLGIALI